MQKAKDFRSVMSLLALQAFSMPLVKSTGAAG